MSDIEKDKIIPLLRLKAHVNLRIAELKAKQAKVPECNRNLFENQLKNDFDAVKKKEHVLRCCTYKTKKI